MPCIRPSTVLLRLSSYCSPWHTASSARGPAGMGTHGARGYFIQFTVS
ncbi:MAG: hypothetical protein ACP6IY_19285 [Promethearchaeia archaeon]